MDFDLENEPQEVILFRPPTNDSLLHCSQFSALLADMQAYEDRIKQEVFDEAVEQQTDEQNDELKSSSLHEKENEVPVADNGAEDEDDYNKPVRERYAYQAQCLNAFFSQFGLVESVRMFEGKSWFTIGQLGAFVSFFSRIEAQRACEALAQSPLICAKPARFANNRSAMSTSSSTTVTSNGAIVDHVDSGFNGRHFSQSKPELSMPSMMRLANKYIGCTNWNSEIKCLKEVYWKKVYPNIDEKTHNPSKALQVRAFTATVLVTVRKDPSFTVEASGSAAIWSKDMQYILDSAKKQAVTNALKRAFENMAILIDRNGNSIVAPLPTEEEDDTGS